MKILIIGAGSLGCLFGAKLALNNHDVYAIGSEKIYKKVYEEGLFFQEFNKPAEKLTHIHFFASQNEFLNEKINQSNFDLCIISCKAYSLSQITSQYESLISQFQSVFLLQNGLGNEEILKSKFPNLKIYRIISSMGAMLENYNHIIQTGDGLNFICRISNLTHENNTEGNREEVKISEIIRNFNKAGISIKKAKNSLKKIWEKAIINIVINPLGALLNEKNGNLLNNPYFWKSAEHLIHEILMVMESYQLPFDSFDEIHKKIKIVLEKTKDNSNSMLQDLRRNKPTEIEFLNQKIVDLGKKRKIATPFNKTIVILIKAREFSLKNH
ncbi:MAG: ketopantoate reductase family protein [Candidatus Lokiarchaeota archaeon]|nr:ketopantoate reductase family protein [Candidatus Harpocratesius repetitus]